MDEIKDLPNPPFEFKGCGYIMLYKFDEEFVRQDTFLPDALKNNYCGGLGAVIYVNYLHSPIGPYHELLFIPGKFYYRNHKRYFISKAYVSTEEAVKLGRNSWYIPKEFASFYKEKLTDDTENITVSVNGEHIASFELRARGIKFPVSTNLITFPLMQLNGEDPIKLNYSGQGIAKLTKLESIEIRPAFFPDIAQFIPLSIIKMKDFNLHFPKGEFFTEQ